MHSFKKEKAAIVFPVPNTPASIPDTERFVDALNAGALDSFAPRLAPDIELMSEGNDRLLHGRLHALNFFATRLDTGAQHATGDQLAVIGAIHPPHGDDNETSCAILYDGFHKACVMQLSVGNERLIERIMLSARETTLRRAWPVEPPVFRQSAVMPDLGGPHAEL